MVGARAKLSDYGAPTMYARSNQPASDLRARAEQVRAGNKLFPPTTRTAPTEQGERLATAARGDSEELRITLGYYNERPYLSLRIWSRDASGQWWPTKDKGIAIRRHEMATLAEGVAAALDRFDAMPKQDGAR